jgi:hypothetical protein
MHWSQLEGKEFVTELICLDRSSDPSARRGYVVIIFSSDSRRELKAQGDWAAVGPSNAATRYYSDDDTHNVVDGAQHWKPIR